MKKISLLFALCCLSLVALGQKPYSVFAGVQNQLSLQRLTYRWSISPTATLQIKHQQLMAGPVILLKDYSGTAAAKAGLNGAFLTYRYLINRNPGHKLNVFAEASTKAQWLKEDWVSNYWHTEEQQYKDVALGSRELLWGNYLGIGVQLKVLPRFIVHTSGALGYNISRLKFKGSSPSVADNNVDYRGYGSTGLSYAVSVGIALQLR